MFKKYKEYSKATRSRLEAEIERLTAELVIVNAWVSVKDRLPDEDEGDVLLVQTNGQLSTVYTGNYSGGKWSLYCDDGVVFDCEDNYYWISHWKPLPSLPKPNA